MGQIEDLEKLQELKESGILTEEEFRIEKEKIFYDSTNNKSTDYDNISNNKLPLKLNFKQTMVIITTINILIIIIIICLLNRFFDLSNIFVKDKWITEINNEKVFNIDYNEFVIKAQIRLEELSGKSIKVCTGSELYISKRK